MNEELRKLTYRANNIITHTGIGIRSLSITGHRNDKTVLFMQRAITEKEHNDYKEHQEWIRTL